MTPLQPIRIVLSSLRAGVLLPLCFFSAQLLGQSTADRESQFSKSAQTALEPSGPAASGMEVDSLIQSIGIAGFWKLGHPCAVTVRVPNDVAEDSKPQSSGRVPATVEITTVDGDAVEVVYRRNIDAEDLDRINADANREFAVPVRIGRARSVISATMLDELGDIIEQQDFKLPPNSGLSPTQPLVVTIGGAQGIEDLVRTSADGLQQSISVVNIEQADVLPSTMLEYAAVDLVVLATSATDLLTQMDDSQWTAIDDFIRNGGACVISLGASGDELRKTPRLLNWLPGELNGKGVIRSPAALESLVTTDQAIQPFPATIWRSNKGQTRLVLSDSLGKQTSWWVSFPHGFGTIQVIASDLGHPSFSKWKHRRLLWERLVAPVLDKTDIESVKPGSKSSTDSYLGYSDLTGQLRATLEQFNGVQVVTFSQIALALIGLVILIGPVDYYVSVKWLKLPHLSWPLTGAVLLISSLALFLGYRQMRPDRVMVNTAAILDVDSQTGRTVGHQWSHIYSARARRINVKAGSQFSEAPIRLDWQGLPGAGLGGLQSSVRIERGMPAYQVDLSSDGGSQLIALGIPAAGTKSLYATWVEQLPLVTLDAISTGTQGSKVNAQLADQPLREMSTVDQLEGVVVNPLNVDIRDAALFYHRWYYALKSRIPAGDRVVLTDQIIPRDISRRLNKQQEMDGKLTTARWDPADRGQLDRLLELLMFHKAATGKNYTSLTHRYQPNLDHSNLLSTNYALLVGRLDVPPTELLIESTLDDENLVGPKLETTPGLNRTWVRILLPVTTNN